MARKGEPCFCEFTVLGRIREHHPQRGQHGATLERNISRDFQFPKMSHHVTHCPVMWVWIKIRIWTGTQGGLGFPLPSGKKGLPPPQKKEKKRKGCNSQTRPTSQSSSAWKDQFSGSQSTRCCSRREVVCMEAKRKAEAKPSLVINSRGFKTA